MGEAEVKHGPDERLAASMASVPTIPSVIPAAYDVRVRTSMNGSHTVKAIVGGPPSKSAGVLDRGAGVLSRHNRARS